MRLRAQTSTLIAAVLVISASNGAFGSPPQSPSENSECGEWVIHSALYVIRRKDYEQGRLLLKDMISRECSLMPAAMLLTADSQYREGGSHTIANAEGEYARWLELFPEQELAPLVMKKMAEAHLRQVNGRSGDDHAALANRALLKLQHQYPHFSVDPTVQEYNWITEELLAEHQLKVARFYIDARESAAGAKIRCLQILERFPQFTKMDIALWYLAQADERLAQTEEWEANINEAIESYERIAREHADGQYRDRAIDRLKHYGRDAPEADQEIAAKLRERASRVTSILADLDGYILGISQIGVLLNEEDEVDSEGLNKLLKDWSPPSASATKRRKNN